MGGRGHPKNLMYNTNDARKDMLWSLFRTMFGNAKFAMLLSFIGLRRFLWESYSSY